MEVMDIVYNTKALGQVKASFTQADLYCVNSLHGHQPNRLNECQQYKNAYIELAFSRSLQKLEHFLTFNYYPTRPLTPNELVKFVCCVLTFCSL